MAQGHFTKQEAAETKKAVEEMFDAIPKSKRLNYIGHLNDIFLFIEAAQRAAPDEKDVPGEAKPPDSTP
jgi:hypothetical protein